MTSQVFAPRVLFEADRARTAIDEHLRIVESIEQGDGEAAEALARAHIRNSDGAPARPGCRRRGLGPSIQEPRTNRAR